MDAHHGGVAAGHLHGVGHNGVVILFPDPAARSHVGRSQDGLQRFQRVLLLVEAGLAGQCGALLVWALIHRRSIGQRRDGHVGFDLALVLDDKTAGVGGDADHGEIQLPLLKDGFGLGLAARLQDCQHALLAFRQHHLIGGHVRFALGHLVQVQLDAAAALVAHFGG
jgi:hypothetical protein